MRIRPGYIWPLCLCLAALALGAAAPAARAANGPLTVRAGQESYFLAPYMEILFDPSRSLTLDQVRRPPWSERFRPANDSPTLRPGLTTAAIWLRFRLAGLTSGRRYYLEMDSAQLEHLDAFVPLPPATAGGPPRYQKIEAGYQKPNAGRPIAFRTFIIPLGGEAPAGADYYLRMSNSGTIVVRPYLWTEQGLASRLNWDNTFFGVIFGVLAAMLLTNLFFFVALRDPVYLFYVLYVSCMMSFEACLYGQWDQWLGGFPLPGATAVWLAAGLVTIFAAQFSRSFLRLPYYAPRLDKAFWALMAAGAGLMGLTLAGFLHWASLVTHVLGMVGPVCALGAAVLAWRRGYWPARFFLVAWSVLMVAMFSLAVKGLGYLPQALSSTYTMPLATAIEAVLLSLALAERVRHMRHRGEEAERRERRFLQMSMTDGLTGLYNKRFFDSRLQSEMDHAQRSGEPLSLLVVDVDDFKGFNDTHGHIEGDKVLRTLARVVRERIRTADFACRYGGDEFVVIMPATEPDPAMLAAERVRSGFHDQPFHPDNGGTVWASLSAGLAQYQPGDTPDQLMSRADGAMYQAKREGGNRCARA